MDADEYEELTDILRDAVGNNALSEWERSFVDDMNAKVEQYGYDTMVSSKQWDVLRRIQSKL
jgi:hypothetical protein